VNAVFQAKVAVSAIARAASTELRGIGSERSRSMNPCSRSSAVAVTLPMPLNSTPVAMNLDEEVDIGRPGDVDRPAEHVPVDQRHLDRREHDQLRRAQVAQPARGGRRSACS
jgi:hypothetical protein